MNNYIMTDTASVRRTCVAAINEACRLGFGARGEKVARVLRACMDEQGWKNIGFPPVKCFETEQMKRFLESMSCQ